MSERFSRPSWMLLIYPAMALLALLSGHAPLGADPRKLPARTVQGPVPGEPPLAGEGGPCPADSAPPSVTPSLAAPLAITPGAPAGAVEPMDPSIPTVAIRVRVPANGAPGRELEYRIFVDNISRSAAHHVIVRVPIPSTARYARANPAPSQESPEVQWRLGTLDPGTRREFGLVLIPAGSGDVRVCARVQFEHGQCVTTRLGGPPQPVQPPQPPSQPAPAAPAALRIHKEGPTRAMRFDALSYRIEVTNTGGSPANDVVLVDTLPDGLEFSTSSPSTTGENPLTWKLGILAPGQSRRVEYQTFAKKAGELVNRATVTAAGGLRQEATQTVIVGEARLTATMVGPQRRIVNRPATYQVTVANAGTSAISGLKITNEVPADVTFVNASQGGQLVGNAITWTLGALAPGGKWVVQFTVKARKAGELTNRANVSADRGITAQASAVTLFEGATGLTVEIDKSDDPIEVGRQAIYTVRVLNQGSAAASKLGLSLITPDLVKVAAARDPSGRPAQQDRNRITFEPVATLAGGAEASFSITVQGVQPGAGKLRVELTADQLTPGNPLKQEESITVFGGPPR